MALLLPGARARTTLPAGTRGRRVQGLLHSAEDGKPLVNVGDSKGAEHFGVGTTIDFRSPVAVYEQLAGILRQQIRDGMLPPDEQLPSQKDLVTTYKVARGTAARAVKMLQEEGLARRVPGKGIYVWRRA